MKLIKRLRTETGALGGLSLLTLVVLLAHRAGDLLPETKLDLLVDPGRFLGRATYFWDPSADFGRIQNQAVGYLWPMGPFFVAGNALSVPAWITQRLWLASLILIALWGMHTVLRRLEVGTPSSRVIGAATYALAPSFLATMIYQSAAQIPVAALPWIMVPLLRRDEDGAVPAGAAWRSALAVACIGAVNGAAAIIVLVVPALWFLTRERPLQHWRLAGTWAGASLLGMAWWLAPLTLQGRYGFAFTEFTERASLTTATQSATEALRGTGSWLSYLVVDGRPLVAGARAMAIDRAAIIATLLVAGVALSGLIRRDLRERTWLISCALLGLVATGMAFVGPLGGIAASPARDLLDGALAPFRNVQKFAVLVRFPMAIGVAHLLASARLPAWTRVGRSPRAPRIVLVAMLLAVLIPVARAQQSGLSPDGSFEKIPTYWVDAADWLDENGGGRRTLVGPSSPFGEYTWGRPLDEPMQALAESPWAVRNIIPLGGTGPTRLLDELDRRLINRQLGPGTSELLARLGVRHLLIRNDLDRARTLSPAPGVMRAALEATPGLRLAESFGPVVGSSLLGDQITPEFGPAALDDIQAIEIWEVPTPTGRVTAYDEASTLAVVGGPDAVFELADAGLVAGRATVMANADAPSVATDAWAITDATRLRDATYATVRDDVSYTLQPGQLAPNTGRAPEARLDPDLDDSVAAATLTGAAEISSSSYALSSQTRYPGTQPWAAFDDDATSAWYPATAGSPVGAWIQVGFDEPRRIPSVTIARPADTPGQVLGVRVITDAGAVEATFDDDEDQLTATLPEGATTTIRTEIAAAVRAGSGFGSPGLSSIDLEGVSLARPIVSASERPSWVRTEGPPVMVFDRARTDPANRLKADEDVRLDRIFDLDTADPFAVALRASPNPGPELDAFVADLRDALGAVDTGVSTSSTWEGLPAFASDAAHDDDLATSWVADADDLDPGLEVTWGGPVTLSQIRIQGPGFPSQPIGQVRLIAPSGVRTVDIGTDGVGDFSPLATESVRIELSDPGSRPLQVARPQVNAISEVTFDVPVPPVRSIDDDQEIGLACGEGPDLRIDDQIVETSIATTWGELERQQPALVLPCTDSVDLDAGLHRLSGPSDNAFNIDGVTLDPEDRTVAPPARTTRVLQWGNDQRQIEVGAGDANLITTSENANPGWVARYQGQELEPVVVDGWRQGWRLPAGRSGVVELTFEPGQRYRAFLAIGAALALVVVLLSIGPLRRRIPGWSRSRRPVAPLRGLPLPAVAVVATVVMAALAGPLCVLVPVLFLARRARVLTLVIGGALVLAAFATLRSPLGSTIAGTGSFSALAQSAAVVAIGGLALGLLPDGGEPADEP